jgi:hypothetical protein
LGVSCLPFFPARVPNLGAEWCTRSGELSHIVSPHTFSGREPTVRRMRDESLRRWLPRWYRSQCPSKHRRHVASEFAPGSTLGRSNAAPTMCPGIGVHVANRARAVGRRSGADSGRRRWGPPQICGGPEAVLAQGIAGSGSRSGVCGWFARAAKALVRGHAGGVPQIASPQVAPVLPQESQALDRPPAAYLVPDQHETDTSDTRVSDPGERAGPAIRRQAPAARCPRTGRTNVARNDRLAPPRPKCGTRSR